MQLSYLACYSATPSAHTPLTNKTCILAPDLARGYEGASDWNEGHGGLEAAPAPPLISVVVSDRRMGLRLRKSQLGEEEASPPQPRTPTRTRPTRTRPPSGAVAAPAPLTFRTSSLMPPPPGRAIVRKTALPSPYVLGIWSTLAEAAAQGRLQSTTGLVRNFRLVEQCYSGERLVSCLLLLSLAADRLHALSIISQVSLLSSLQVDLELQCVHQDGRVCFGGCGVWSVEASLAFLGSFASLAGLSLPARLRALDVT